MFDTRHQSYDHAVIGTIVGNLATGCQYRRIYSDYAIILIDAHLKYCWKLMIGVQGLQMGDDNEYLLVLVQTSFQLTNTVHPKLKQPVLRDCVSTGIGNAQVEGVSYDSIGIPNDWYFQYKSLTYDKRSKDRSRHFL